MTETPETTETEVEQTDAETEVEETDPQTFDAEYVRGLREEAAAHRVRASEAEQRAEAAVARLRSLAIRDATRDVLADPADLPWTDDLADEEGWPDPERITAAATALIETKPHYGRVSGDVGQGYRSQQQPISLAEALRMGA